MRKCGFHQKGFDNERPQRKSSGGRRKVSGVEIEAEGSRRLRDIRGFGGGGAGMEDGWLQGPRLRPRDQGSRRAGGRLQGSGVKVRPVTDWAGLGLLPEQGLVHIRGQNCS